MKRGQGLENKFRKKSAKYYILKENMSSKKHMANLVHDVLIFLS